MQETIQIKTYMDADGLLNAEGSWMGTTFARRAEPQYRTAIIDSVKNSLCALIAFGTRILKDGEVDHTQIPKEFSLIAECNKLYFKVDEQN